MKNDFSSFIGFCGLVAGFAGVGYAVGVHTKMKDVCTKIDKSIDEIADEIEIKNIPEKLVDKAIDKAVEREVEREVTKAIDKAIREVKYDIHREVERTVKNEYADIKTRVSDEVSRSVSNLDMKELEKEIVKKAQAEVVRKFDNSLDDLLNKFNDNLKNTSRIYSSMANAITGCACNNDRGISLRLN